MYLDTGYLDRRIDDVRCFMISAQLSARKSQCFIVISHDFPYTFGFKDTMRLLMLRCKKYMTMDHGIVVGN